MTDKVETALDLDELRMFHQSRINSGTGPFTHVINNLHKKHVETIDLAIKYRDELAVEKARVAELQDKLLLARTASKPSSGVSF